MELSEDCDGNLLVSGPLVLSTSFSEVSGLSVAAPFA